MRLESLAPLSLLLGSHVVRLGTHTSRAKRTWDLQKQPEHIGQNVTVQTPNVSENSAVFHLSQKKMTTCWRSCPHSQTSSHFQSSVLET